MSLRLCLRPLAIAVMAVALAAAVPRTATAQDHLQILRDYNADLEAGRYREAEQRARFAIDAANNAGNELLSAGWTLKLADAVREQTRFAEAESIYRRALPVLERHLGPDGTDTISCLNGLAITCRFQGRYAEAMPLYQRAIDAATRSKGPDSPDLGFPLNGLGMVHWREGRYVEAEAAFRRAAANFERAYGPDDPRVVMPLINLAGLCLDVHRVTEARALFQRVLAVREKVLGTDHPYVASALLGLGNVYRNQGRLDEALPMYKRALAIYAKKLGAESIDVATTASNIGRVLMSHGWYAEAEETLKYALEVGVKAMGPENPLGVDALFELAGMYTRQKRFGEAEPLYKRLITVHEKAGPSGQRGLSLSVANLAYMYTEQGRFDKAEPLFRRAMEDIEKVEGADASELCFSLYGLARVERSRGRLGEARPLIDRAITLAERGNIRPEARHDFYQFRAELSWESGRRDAAADDLRTAIRLAEDVRGGAFGAERERADLFVLYTEVYERMVQWQAELGDVAAALAAIERSRARSLLDEMATAGADLQAGRSDKDRIRIERAGAAAHAAVARLEAQLGPAQADPARKAQAEKLRGELAEARMRVYEHERDVRAGSRVYRELLNKGAEPPTLDEIRARVCAGGGLLLEYFLGKDAGYVVAVGPDSARLTKLELNDEDAKILGVEGRPLTADRLHAAMAGKNGDGVGRRLSDPASKVPVDGLAALWRVLIPDALRAGLADGSVTRLVVVPDGPLATLPFEALVVEPGDDPKYLLDVGPPVVYAPSATVLMGLAGRPARASSPSDREPVLALGDPAYPGSGPTSEASANGDASARYMVAGGALKRLPFSGWEAQWVAKAFRDAGVKAGSLTGATATEAGVRYWAPGRKVLHLACHGLADETLGNFYGALALAPGPAGNADPANDGFLQLSEIHDLDLRGCELVILSACQTNFGPQQIGEGTWSLSRGFLVAGARRVAASNWLVDDEAAASLVSVYSTVLARAQKEGKPADYAAALRDAKRWVRKQEKWKAPYYWATLVLVGPP